MIFNTCRLITRRYVVNVRSNITRNMSRIPIGPETKKNLRSTVYYFTSVGILFVGLSYAAVPLYRMFCQAFSYGGTVGIVESEDSKVKNIKPVKNRELIIRFNADTGATMRWNFKPLQNAIRVVPGETALAFYTATNPTDKPIIGISTYNVVPFEVGQYFNKIQCFCFEEQQLNPHEQVDMPVFFYLDPEIVDDPRLESLSEVVLSYTFFEAKEGFKLPVPNYVKKHFDKSNVTRKDLVSS